MWTQNHRSMLCHTWRLCQTGSRCLGPKFEASLQVDRTAQAALVGMDIETKLARGNFQEVLPPGRGTGPHQIHRPCPDSRQLNGRFQSRLNCMSTGTPLGTPYPPTLHQLKSMMLLRPTGRLGCNWRIVQLQSRGVSRMQGGRENVATWHPTGGRPQEGHRL
jgi:hypothetical protein